MTRARSFTALVVVAGLAMGLVVAAAFVLRDDRSYRTTALLAPQADAVATSSFATLDPDEARQLLQTSARLARVDAVVRSALARLDVPLERSVLLDSVQARVLQPEQLLEISAVASHPGRSMAFTDAVADSLVQYRLDAERARIGRLSDAIQQRLGGIGGDAALDRSERRLLRDRLVELRAHAATTTGDLIVVEGALRPEAPLPRQWTPALAVGGLGGALLALVAVLGRFLMTRGRLSAEESLRAGGQDIIASLPRHRSLRQPLRDDGRPPHVTVATRGLADAVLRRLGGGRSVLVTSAKRLEGRTTVAAILAGELAKRGSRVLLVEADLGRPRLADHTDLAEGPGLADVALAEAEPAAAVTELERKDDGGLYLMHAGRRVEDPAELLAQAPVATAISADGRFEYVVVDAPPGAAATPLLDRVDAILVVSRPGIARAFDAERLAETLTPAGDRVVGGVVNGHRSDPA